MSIAIVTCGAGFALLSGCATTASGRIATKRRRKPETYSGPTCLEVSVGSALIDMPLGRIPFPQSSRLPSCAVWVPYLRVHQSPRQCQVLSPIVQEYCSGSRLDTYFSTENPHLATRSFGAHPIEGIVKYTEAKPKLKDMNTAFNNMPN